MAAVEKVVESNSNHSSAMAEINGDAEKDDPLETLMEKLRTKSSHYKPWGDMAKAIRTAVTDKRHLIDNIERNQLQKCLDTIQKSIKVTSLQSMTERLESITRQQGLKFQLGPNGTECYIKSDMFYIEIILDPNGDVKDTKIAHHGDPSSCTELTKVLRNGDFAEFTKHLEGLLAIYQLNADKKQKTKAYLALHALETDLSTLAQMQSSINDPTNLVHKSPVGILQLRQGGSPMKLTYFISPYDLLDVETKSSIPLTVDAVLERHLGHSVTVCIESSTAHKLQTMSLLGVSKTPEGKSLPSFSALSNLNSTTLPASFVLQLPNATPMATTLIKKIQALTSTECADMSTCQPLLSLIIKEASGGKLECRSDQGLFVTLPDQHHCYFLNSTNEFQGALVSAIPFTHPTHVPQILVFLRQQMLFNTVIGSCVRPSSKQDVESPWIFEVTALSTSHITVSFKHPMEESLATAELDLKDITNVKCKIYTLSSDASICTDEYASKVMQRCLSIPVTMRAVIRKAQGQQQQLRPSSQGDVYCSSIPGGGSVSYLSQHPGYSRGLSNGTGFAGGEFTNLSSHISSKQNDSGIAGINNDQIGQMVKPLNIIHAADQTTYSVPPPLSHNTDVLNPIHSQSLTSTNSQDLYGINAERNVANATNPLLGTLLSQNPATAAAQLAQYQQQMKQGPSNTMLMSMLSDIPAANSPSATFPFLGQTTTAGPNKPKKQRKRKGTSDSRSPGSSTGRSPKRKLSEDDSMIRDLPTSDLESSDNASIPFDMNTLPAGVTDQSLVVRVTPLESYLKSDVSAQRTSSIDTVRTNITDIEANVVNDDCSSSVDSYNSLQPKRRYSFNSESDFNMEYSNKVTYSEGIESDDIDLDSCDSNAFGMDLNPSMMASKLAATMDKQNKKLKKHKVDTELKVMKGLLTEEKVEVQDSRLSGESNPTFPSSSYASTVEQSHVEEQLSKTPPLSQSPDLGTSLKIARSGDGLKVSKSEAKLKRKEGRKLDDGSLGKRKGDAKKERKRKRTENTDDDSKSPVRPLHLMLDSTLMPPPSTSSSEVTSPLVSTTADSQSLRHAKSLPAVSSLSTSPSRSKSPSFSNKKSVLTAHRSNSPTSKLMPSGKSGQGDKILKPLPIRQPHVSVGKTSSSDGDSSFGNSKVTLSTSSIKVQTKHKQGNNSKTNVSSISTGGSSAATISIGSGQTPPSSSYTSSGNSSPSKSSAPQHTLKLKNINLPSSTTITPVPVKTHTSSPSFLAQAPIGTQTVPTSSVSITPASMQSGKSPSNSNAKVGKSLLKSSRKGLNAVIDKLMVTASAQHINTSLGDGSKVEGPGNKMEYSLERKESKSEKKEASKESLKQRESAIVKGSESKPKYSSSDQFTVKQSSQGTKLTITKTKLTDNSKSLGSKIKQASKQLSVSSNSTTSTKTVSSGNSSVKTGGSFTQKKAVISSSCISPKSTSGQSKSTSSLAKSQNPSTVTTTVPTSSSRVLSSSNSISKPTTKMTVSSQSKTTLLNATKVSSDKLDKLKTANFETKTSPSLENRSDKVSNNFISIGTNLMPPPLHPNKPVSEHNRTAGSGSSVTNRHEESSLRQSPRHTPTRETTREESDGERAFRLLLAQTTADSQNGTANTEQRVLTPKAELNSGGIVENAGTSAKLESVSKIELEETTQWASSSSTDAKLSCTTKCLSDKRTEEIVSENPLITDSTERKILSTQVEIPSNKLEVPVTTTSLTSSEEVSRSSVSPFPSKSRRGFPSSEDSSPEDGLIIDCPATPRLQKSPEKKVSWSSPRVETTLINDEKIDSPTIQFNAKSPYQPSPSIKSPIPVTTPPSNHSASSSMSRQSPYVIDDDLMDEALIGVGK